MSLEIERNSVMIENQIKGFQNIQKRPDSLTVDQDEILRTTLIEKPAKLLASVYKKNSKEYEDEISLTLRMMEKFVCIYELNETFIKADLKNFKSPYLFIIFVLNKLSTDSNDLWKNARFCYLFNDVLMAQYTFVKNTFIDLKNQKEILGTNAIIGMVNSFNKSLKIPYDVSVLADSLQKLNSIGNDYDLLNHFCFMDFRDRFTILSAFFGFMSGYMRCISEVDLFLSDPI